MTCNMSIPSITAGIAAGRVLAVLFTVTALADSFSLLQTRSTALHSVATTNTCPFLGQLTPLTFVSDDTADAVVQQRQVPTFAANGNAAETQFRSSGNDIIPHDLSPQFGNHGPVLFLENVLSHETCATIIDTITTKGDGDNGSMLQYYNFGKTKHGAMQLIITSPKILNGIMDSIEPYIDMNQIQALKDELDAASDTSIATDASLSLHGLHCRWRIYSYEPGTGDTFGPHIDAGFPPSGIDAHDDTKWHYDISEQGDETILSRLTVLLYLNDDFEGGCTTFYKPLSQSNDELQLLYAVKPKTGSCLIFPQTIPSAVDYTRQHWPLHEGSPVESGNAKYVIRSDILFEARTA